MSVPVAMHEQSFFLKFKDWRASFESASPSREDKIDSARSLYTSSILRLAPIIPLLLALALRLWHLTQNGWGNDYYTAGVRSMTMSWHNFLYNSFDPAGFVSLDKPPVALWIQAISARLFGFHSLSVLVPQVLEGVAAVCIVYHLVERRFGAWAGLLVAVFLAVTPVSVAIDRSSNTDSCLVLVLLLAAWALTRAAEEGNRRLLLLSMALIGIGFNVKMLAAFVVLPTFAAVYFLGAPLPRRRRLQDLAAAAVVLVAVSLAWVVIYDQTPADHRPFAGTTKKNSMLELAVGPYAVGRFVPPVKRSDTAQGARKPVEIAATGTSSVTEAATPAATASGSGLRRLFVRAPAGPLRLADGQLAGQVGWLFPLAVIGLMVAASGTPFRSPLAPEHQSLLLWFGWAVTYGVVYSFAGGIMHLYYLATMGPPLAALAGIGVVSLWRRYVWNGWGAFLLPATLLLTAMWELHVEASALGWKLADSLNPMAALIALRDGAGTWHTWLHVGFLSGAIAGAGGLLVMFCRRAMGRRDQAGSAVALGIALLALLAVPVAWALSSVLVPGHGILPSADLARLISGEEKAGALYRSGLAKITSTSKLVGFLKANRGGERYLLATSSARMAAPIIIATGEAVMAMGGFHGLDPILSPEKLARMRDTNQIRFVMLGDLSVISRRLGAEEAGRPLAEWVRGNGKLVDSTWWRSSRDGRSNLTLYDLRPAAALIPSPSE